MTTLPSGWTEVALGELMPKRRGSIDPRKFSDEEFSLLSIPAFDAGSPERVLGSAVGSTKQLVEPGDVLLAKIVPHIRRAWIVPPAELRSIGSSEWIVFRDHSADPGYLRHLLVSDRFHRSFMQTVAGVGGSLLRARPAHVAKIRVPLPPLEEQRRIAAILDKADELRAKRRAALKQLDSLTQSIFLDTFADLEHNPHHFPTVPFGELLAQPLRNGVSPANSGEFSARVLTLAAITGAEFNEAAAKTAPFVTSPPSNKRVSTEDFLICRGNGNPDLVGRGCYPRRALPEVVFPDTMIAARVDHDRLAPEFLGHVWRQPVVRRQLGAKSRTTNGTHKINQQMIESVQLPVPPIQTQRDFGSIVASAFDARQTHRRFAAELDSLFESLQARAFRGEL